MFPLQLWTTKHADVIVASDVYFKSESSQPLNVEAVSENEESNSDCELIETKYVTTHLDFMQANLTAKHLLSSTYNTY
jgi:hypothetical protein